MARRNEDGVGCWQAVMPVAGRGEKPENVIEARDFFSSSLGERANLHAAIIDALCSDGG